MKDSDRPSSRHQGYANFKRDFASREDLASDHDLAERRKNFPPRPQRQIKQRPPTMPIDGPITQDESIIQDVPILAERTKPDTRAYLRGYELTPEETSAIIAQRMREQAEKFLELYRTNRATPPWIRFANHNVGLIEEVQREIDRKTLGKY